MVLWKTLMFASSVLPLAEAAALPRSAVWAGPIFAAAVLLAGWIGYIPFLSELFEDKSRQGDIHLLVDSAAFFI